MPPKSRTGLVAGWLAAAAGFALAAVGWWPQLQPDDRVETLESVLSVPDVQPPAKTAAAMRDDLLASRHPALKVPWTATGDPAAKGAAGDVVWSNDAQEGYLRFSGLAANNPGEHRYQLWIFDASRDERYPIDGGVFDVESETGDSVVPVAARIRVGKPALFTVTVEKPGGVVVSKRERIVVTAKVGP